MVGLLLLKAPFVVGAVGGGGGKQIGLFSGLNRANSSRQYAFSDFNLRYCATIKISLLLLFFG